MLIRTKSLLDLNKNILSSRRLSRRLQRQRSPRIIRRHEFETSYPQPAQPLSRLTRLQPGGSDEIAHENPAPFSQATTEPEPAPEFPMGIMDRVRQALAQPQASSDPRPSWSIAPPAVLQRSDPSGPASPKSPDEAYFNPAEHPIGETHSNSALLLNAQQRTSPSIPRFSQTHVEERTPLSPFALESKPKTVLPSKLEPELPVGVTVDESPVLESTEMSVTNIPRTIQPEALPSALFTQDRPPEPSPTDGVETMVASRRLLTPSPPSPLTVQRTESGEDEPVIKTSPPATLTTRPAEPRMLTEQVMSEQTMQPAPLQSAPMTERAPAVTLSAQPDRLPLISTPESALLAGRSLQAQPVTPLLAQPTGMSDQPATNVPQVDDSESEMAGKTPGSLQTAQAAGNSSQLLFAALPPMTSVEQLEDSEPEVATAPFVSQTAVYRSEGQPQIITPFPAIQGAQHMAQQPEIRQPELSSKGVSIQPEPIRLVRSNRLPRPFNASSNLQRKPVSVAEAKSQPASPAFTPTIPNQARPVAQTADRRPVTHPSPTTLSVPNSKPADETAFIQRRPVIQADSTPNSTTPAIAGSPPSAGADPVIAKDGEKPALDLEQIAHQVYQLLYRRLRIEQERSRGSILS